MDNALEFGGEVVFTQNASPRVSQPVSLQQVADLRLAAMQMTGAKRRAFQAEMTEQYCAGNARQAERLFGWGRETIEVGLAESRTSITCLGAQSVFSGRPRWEAQQPQAAAALRALAEGQAQQDPTFRTPLAYTRLTANSVSRQSRIGGRGAPRPGLYPGASAGAQYNGERAQSVGLSPAQGPESPTAKEDSPD
jgi:hypothetical protein